jgi:hypothetical protein
MNKSQVKVWIQKENLSYTWWFMPVIPALQRWKPGASLFETSVGKKLKKPHLN